MSLPSQFNGHAQLLPLRDAVRVALDSSNGLSGNPLQEFFNVLLELLTIYTVPNPLSHSHRVI
jgi:hypothetical protein